MNINFLSFVPFLSFFLILAASFYILFKPKITFMFRLLGLGGLVLAFIEFSHFMVLSSAYESAVIFWENWVLRGVLVFSFSAIFFSLVFLRANSKEFLKRWSLFLILSFSACVWLIFLSFDLPVISGIRILSKGYGFNLARAGQFMAVYVLINLVSALINFENTFRSFDRAGKKKISSVLSILCLILSTYLIMTSLCILFSYIDTRFSLAASFLIMIFVVSGMSFYLRVKDFAVKVHVKRQVLYTSATLIIVGVYLLVIGLFTKLFMALGFNVRNFLAFLAAFAVFFGFLVIIFSPILKQRLKSFVDRSFTRSYDYRREWFNLSEQTGTILDLEDLLIKVKSLVKEIMHVESAEIVLCRDNRSGFPAFSDDFKEWLLRFGRPVTVTELTREQPLIREKNKPVLDSLGAAMVNAMTVKQQTLGFLSVGLKQDRSDFSEEDKDLLKVISRQAAISVLNAQLSEELIVSREMEQFNKFSSFIIHDLKNCVSMLSMIMQNSKDNFARPEFQKAALTTLNGTINRMKDLMHKFSSIPKELELKKSEADLNQLVSGIIDEKVPSRQSSIKVFKYLNPLPEIKIDKNYIYKVFLNLILNALEAMPEGGNLILRSTLQDTAPGFNRRHVQVSISDTGKGMSKEFISRKLFKPFQTSKRKGIGLGLYQCKTIIEAHGGAITAESEEGKGSTFFVRLPLEGKGKG